MIDSVYILNHDSGLPLLHVDVHSHSPEHETPVELFSGVLQSIRLFLKEIKIGNLADFTTHNKRIEINNEGKIVVAVIADINDPSENVVETITQDICAMFLAQYEKKVENFSGNLSIFKPFATDILEYINLQLQVHFDRENEPIIKSLPRSDSKSFTEWLKNQFNPSGNVLESQDIRFPSNYENLHIDYVFDGGLRPMNAIDRWFTKNNFVGGAKLIVFVKILDATHGPAQIARILEQIRILGDPKYRDNLEIYQFFPFEILFIGPTLGPQSFRNISKELHQYKDHKILTAIYADHFHREHSHHHEFYRCRISGWNWDLSPISPQSVPQKIFP